MGESYTIVVIFVGIAAFAVLASAPLLVFVVLLGAAVVALAVAFLRIGKAGLSLVRAP